MNRRPAIALLELEPWTLISHATTRSSRTRTPPPSRPLRRRPLTRSAGAPVTIADIWNRTWTIFTERMWSCLRIVWGVVALNWAISLGMNLMVESLKATVRDPNFFTLLYILTLFCAVVLQIWIAWVGQTIAMLKLARGEPVSYADLFTGGPYVLTMILASIVFGLILAVPISIAVGVSVVGFLIMGELSPGGIAVFLMASTLAGLFFIYVSSRLVMYYFLIVDRNAGVFDSLYQSWQLCGKCGNDRSGVHGSDYRGPRGVPGLTHRTVLGNSPGEPALAGNLSLPCGTRGGFGGREVRVSLGGRGLDSSSVHSSRGVRIIVGRKLGSPDGAGSYR